MNKWEKKAKEIRAKIYDFIWNEEGQPNNYIRNEEYEINLIAKSLEEAVKAERGACKTIAKGQWALRAHGYRKKCCEESYDDCAQYIAQAIEDRDKEGEK